jgi:hypothetical protein
METTTTCRLTSRRSQPPLALAVPLSRFASRIQRGSGHGGWPGLGQWPRSRQAQAYSNSQSEGTPVEDRARFSFGRKRAWENAKRGCALHLTRIYMLPRRFGHPEGMVIFQPSVAATQERLRWVRGRNVCSTLKELTQSPRVSLNGKRRAFFGGKTDVKRDFGECLRHDGMRNEAGL